MSADQTGTAGPGARARFDARAFTGLNIALALLLVAALVAAAYFWQQHRRAADQEQARASAESVATQFALRMDRVDSKDLDGYIKQINELLTTKARSQNSKVLDAMKQTYSAAQVKGTGKVLMTAVGDSDDDSATVLVVHDAAVDTKQGKLQHHYRWTVELVKVKKRWLVDDFSQVS